MDTPRLAWLLALSRLGSMRKVADAFGFTRSTVSQQIAALAKVAGEQLIEPDGRRVRLTPAGRRLADHAVTILAAVDAARLDLDPEAEPLICNDPRPLRAPRQRPRAPGGDRRHRPRCLRSVPRSPLRRAGLVRIFPRTAGIEAAGSGGGVPGPNYAPQTVSFQYSIRRRSLRTGINPGSAVVGFVFHIGTPTGWVLAPTMVSESEPTDHHARPSLFEQQQSQRHGGKSCLQNQLLMAFADV